MRVNEVAALGWLELTADSIYSVIFINTPLLRAYELLTHMRQKFITARFPYLINLSMLRGQHAW